MNNSVPPDVMTYKKWTNSLQFRYNLPELTPEVDNLNKLISIKEIESVINNPED